MKRREQAYLKKVRFTRAHFYTFKPLKLPIPFWDSTGGPFTAVPVDAWLILYNQDGTRGQCPCTAKMRDQFLPLLLNGERKSYQEWYRQLYWSIRNYGFSSESAVELGRLDLAFHDMMAIEEGLPLHRFLGAERDWVNVYASGCGTNLTLKQLENEIENFLQQGYTTFKMKAASDFGCRLDDDLERIRMVRSLIGEKNQLAVDVNQLWKAEDALKFLKRVEKFNLAWLEEPVHSYDMTELEKLTKATNIPIAMGESPRCYYPMECYVRSGVSHLQPIPFNMSSVDDWLRTRDLACANQLVLSSGGYSHLTASFIATGHEEDMVEYLYPVMHPLCDIMEYYPQEREGKFILPKQPGISMSPDFELLDRMDYLSTKEYISA